MSESSPPRARIKLGLTAKLVAFMLCVMASVGLLLSALADRALRTTLTSEFESKAQAISLAVASSLSMNTRQEAKIGANLRTYLEQSRSITGVSYIYIQDADGTILAHTFEQFPPFFNDEENWVRPGELSQSHPVKVNPDVNIDLPGGTIHAIDVAAAVADARLGVVHVGMDRSEIEQRMAVFRREMVLSTVAVCLVAILLGIFALFIVVIRPVRELTTISGTIVETGELRHEIRFKSSDELGVLAYRFNQLVRSLRGAVAAMKRSSIDMNVSVSYLAELSSRQLEAVARHAAGLANVSAVAQELKQNSAANAQQARDVLEVADSADRISTEGQKSVEASLEGLGSIRAQADIIVTQISNLAERTGEADGIVESVKDLADQSHILALNASLEAARSGEQGKGFAVVAREMRGLSDESIRRTQQIRKILADVQDAVRGAGSLSEEGRRRMDEGMSPIRASGSTFREIGETLRRSALAAKQIARSVDEQDRGVAELSQAIVELNLAMDNISAGIRSLENAAQDLRSNSEAVSSVISTFKV